MAEAERAFDFIQEFEGGGKLHTIPGDPGGTTKWGFSQRANPDVDIENLTRGKALKLFRERYWDPLRLDEVKSQKIANEVSEFGFNAGIHTGTYVAQQAANYVLSLEPSGWPELTLDGQLGPKTLQALNAIYDAGAVHVAAWLGRFNLLQLKYYRSVDNSLVERFFVGWTRRVID